MATDITQRLSAQPGFFKLPVNNRTTARKIAEIAARVVAPDLGKHGVPYESKTDDNFWHLDSMNDWHLTTIQKDNEWYCLVQYRGALLGPTPVEIMSVYSAVIMHQCKLWLI